MLLEASYYTALDISETVKRLRPDFLLASMQEEAAAAIALLQTEKIDFVIADVEVADGNVLSAFERAKITTPVIFLADTPHFALRAQRLNTVCYLLHPVSAGDLDQAFQHLEQQ